MTASPTNQTAPHSRTAKFYCVAKGGPGNIYRWVKGNPSFKSKTINASDFDSLEVVGTEPQLTLTMVDGSTGGQYTCVVFNDAGYGNDTVTLYVSLRILTQPEDQIVQIGDKVMYTCIADSFPAPTYQWEMFNRATMEFETIENETGTTLTFILIQQEQYGKYHCEVTTPIINENHVSNDVYVAGQ